MNKAIFRRLAVLQQIADRGKPCKVSVTFTDGSTAITNPAGAIDILRGRGTHGEIDSFQTGILHPAPDRRIEDFE